MSYDKNVHGLYRTRYYCCTRSSLTTDFSVLLFYWSLTPEMKTGPNLSIFFPSRPLETRHCRIENALDLRSSTTRSLFERQPVIYPASASSEASAPQVPHALLLCYSAFGFVSFLPSNDGYYDRV